MGPEVGEYFNRIGRRDVNIESSFGCLDHKIGLVWSESIDNWGNKGSI